MAGRFEQNILVISDLHLGEDLKENGAAVSYLRRIVRLERELEAFLAHYTATRIDGRAWRLVVNGDMVDFMSVMILPDADAQAAGDAVSLEERRFGLAHGEWQSLRKLERVMQRHSSVFQRLAEFVAAGNELVVVVGNHDVEFFYPAVQQRFARTLAGLAPARGVEERIRFCNWFYYEESVLYVEHGHQYDEYCSFDYQLHPVESEGNVALSIAHAGIRYFSNLVPTLDPRDAEHWGFVNYMKWAYAQGVRSLAHICYCYGLMIWKLIEIWSRLSDPRADADRREQHRARLRALAVEHRIAAEKIEALDGLRCVPVLRRFTKLLQAMFLDRMIIGVSAVMALAGVLAFTGGLSRIAALGGVLAAGVAGQWLLSWLGRTRLIPSPAALRQAPEAIWRILRAPVIVFGHSHIPERVRLREGGIYFNTGTWAEEEGVEAFTHLVISAGGDGPHAELRQWRDGVSAPFAAAE